MNRLQEVEHHSSPIECLPEELLNHILDILHDSFNGSNDGPQARKRVIITASHVSRLWRFVALENPLWWSDIMITSPWRTEAIETYLERSKPCLLTLSVVAKQPDDGSDPLTTSEDFQHLHDLLFPHFCRCRIIYIRGVFEIVDIEVATSFFERMLHASMPHLERAILETDDDSYDYSKGGSKAIFASSSRLRDLRLIGAGTLLSFFHPLNSTSLFSHSKLSSLHLSKTLNGISFSKLQNILDACPSLTTLAIYNDFLLEWPGLSTSCNVPSLENLYILGNMNKVSELLLFLSVPKLKELIIAPVVNSDLSLLRSGSNDKPDPHRFPALRTLILAPAHLGAFGSLESASICFPQIETLVLANLYLSPFIKVFTSKSSDAGIIFPNLLNLAFTDIDDRFIQAIQNMQVFRTKQHYPLNTLYVDPASLLRLKTCKVTFDDDNTGEAENGGNPSDWVEGDFWEDRRKTLLCSDKRDLYIGGPEDFE
ncbi:hypothetical protein GALMADRAFT_101323 [Galerina marginata CBS 339.88]|uniref:Uncharacterized protein n=1 Tax=Galerina marginata (strain CBS 339.88) TaxID=685588 RepID=A0A067SSD3_GALM3|nr:hypothetical protein GALMADRAFT_101323 [Galerina marginata CBS 339.88]